uniref:Late endosomal/lysosomal adaptor and MAPK and MTOR activator 1 n=1 Tax=Loa loa TaxID=7209 RepID=A0A1I7VFY5_LOALO
MSMTQIIWFSLLLCVTLAYNKTFSPLNPPAYHYPGYNPGVSLNLCHTSDIVDNNLETLPDHNDDTYKSDREQVTIITNDEQSQEVTDGFAYNIERENTDRELLGINVDKDLFPELICNLSPFNLDTSTSNIGGELPGINDKNKIVYRMHIGCISDALRALRIAVNIENARKRTTNHSLTNANDPIVDELSIIHRLPLTMKHIKLNINVKAVRDSSPLSTT